MKRSWRRRPNNKFGVAPKEERTIGARTYDSKGEANYAKRLALMKQALLPDNQRPVSWKEQVTVDLEVNGMWITSYRCDFVVTFADGHTEWHEFKGFETNEWKIKERLFRALFPERRFVVIRR